MIKDNSLLIFLVLLFATIPYFLDANRATT